MRRTAAVGITMVLCLATACTTESPPPDDGVADVVGDDDQARGSDDERDDLPEPDDAQDDDPEVEPSPEPEGANGRLQLSGWREDNPSGVTVALRAVEVDGNGDLLLNFEAVSRDRFQGTAEIAQSAVVVRDDLGNVYEFRQPAADRRLPLGQDERMSGTLAFDGPLDPGARTIDVGFNQLDEQWVAAADDLPSQYPRFAFVDVPLPGVGLEADARGPGQVGDLDRSTTVEVGQEWSADGLEVTVVSYELVGGSTNVTVEASNGRNNVVELALDIPRLRDEAGGQYFFERDLDIDRGTAVVRMEPGDDATVTFGFRGEPTPASTGFTFVLNGNSSEDSPSAPRIEFADLPLPEES